MSVSEVVSLITAAIGVISAFVGWLNASRKAGAVQARVEAKLEEIERTYSTKLENESLKTQISGKVSTDALNTQCSRKCDALYADLKELRDAASKTSQHAAIEAVTTKIEVQANKLYDRIENVRTELVSADSVASRDTVDKIARIREQLAVLQQGVGDIVEARTTIEAHIMTLLTSSKAVTQSIDSLQRTSERLESSLRSVEQDVVRIKAKLEL